MPTRVVRVVCLAPISGLRSMHACVHRRICSYRLREFSAEEGRDFFGDEIKVQLVASPVALDDENCINNGLVQL